VLNLRIAHWFLALSALALASLACQILLPGESEKQSGDIMFQDDFTDSGSGWNRVSSPTGDTEYDDGVYRIFVKEANTDIWSKPGQYFGDTIIEVEAFKVGGERDNRFGVICRATGTDSFYTFIISSDGYYGIGKVEEQNYELLDAEALLPSEYIQKGSALALRERAHNRRSTRFGIGCWGCWLDRRNLRCTRDRYSLRQLRRYQTLNGNSWRF